MNISLPRLYKQSSSCMLCTIQKLQYVTVITYYNQHQLLNTQSYFDQLYYHTQLYSCYTPSNLTLTHNTYTTTTTINPNELTQEQRSELEQFNNEFTIDSIPLSTFDIRHARSSGAGGQNVNKVNTKVDMRFNIHTCYKWLPSIVVQRLTHKYKNKINTSNEFIITSERYRTQQQNYNDCVEKLYDMIKDCSYLPNELTENELNKIKQNRQRADQRRVADKKFKSLKKASRNSKNWT